MPPSTEAAVEGSQTAAAVEPTIPVAGPIPANEPKPRKEPKPPKAPKAVKPAKATQPAQAVDPARPAEAAKPPKPPKPPKAPKTAKPAKAPKTATAVAVAAGGSRRTSGATGEGARRSVARTSISVAIGIVVLALAAATVGAAAVVALPTVTSGVPNVVVTPVASPQTRVCPGPFLGLADQSQASADSATPAVLPLGDPTLVTGIVPTTDTITTDALSTPDVQQGTSTPTTLTAPGSSGTLLGGSQSQALAQSDLAGLATSECGEASADTWLAAGSTVTGRSAYLLLSNPTDVLATVALSIFSESGAVNAPGTSGITVQPHSQRALSLAGFAPNIVSPVIHVTSAGGTVLASLQQSVIRGLTPGGIDTAGPTGAPALSQTIAGVQIVSTSSIAEQAADPASSDLTAALRVFVPGAAAATLSVTFKSETLGVADTTVSYSATGGVVTDFPLPSLNDDTYSVVVSSDQPVVVGARAAVVSGGTDFAWYQSGQSLDGTFLFATATGPNARLMLVNTSSQDAAVTISQTDQASPPATFTVAANSALGYSVIGNMAFTVVTTAPLTASVGYVGDGLISSFSVSPASPLAAPITVYGGTGG
ncbi:DUF5719 family protein [Subtercola sp. YIM 133946]|uniref:DUF5719 family protein n=1 Tax=Subtercola sp. YIM 133946 TaxID=3118909 RepID=UPI002F929716